MSDNFGTILRGGEFADDQRNAISNEFTVVEALASADTAGGVVAVLNPFGVDVIVTDVVLNVTTAATATCTLNAGVAANATTTSDTLIDGVDVNTAVGVFDNHANAGTNGGSDLWESDEYITVSKATGSAAGLEGTVYIRGFQA